MLQLTAPVRFLILAGASLLLIFLTPALTGPPARAAALVFYWPQRLAARGGALAGGLVRPLFGAWRLERENRELRERQRSRDERLARLEAENRLLKGQLAQVELFGRRLDELEGGPPAGTRELTSEDIVLVNAAGRTPAERGGLGVIGYDADQWRCSLLLDRGADRGLTVGSPVICGQTVVGQLAAVGPWSSRAITLEDPTFAAAVLVPRSGARGLIRGDGPGQPLFLTLVKGEGGETAGGDPAPLLAADDLVVTTGESGLFPPRFLVGRVSQVLQPGNEIYPSAEVAPAWSPGLTEAALVLRRGGPLLPAPPPGAGED